MDPALVLLLIFLVYSVLLGVCLSRMRSVQRELDQLRDVVVHVGNVQRDTSSRNIGNVDARLVEQLQGLVSNDG